MSPARAACSAGPAPRNGTCTIFSPGELQEPGAGEVRALADAGRGVVQLVRIGLEVGDQFGDRLDAGRGMRRDDVRESGSCWRPPAAGRPCRSGCGRCCRRSHWGRDCRSGWCGRRPSAGSLRRCRWCRRRRSGSRPRRTGPRPLCRCAASRRPITSVVPPAAAGTMMRMVSVGRQSARPARGNIAAVENAAAPDNTRRREKSLLVTNSLPASSLFCRERRKAIAGRQADDWRRRVDRSTSFSGCCAAGRNCALVRC